MYNDNHPGSRSSSRVFYLLTREGRFLLHTHTQSHNGPKKIWKKKSCLSKAQQIDALKLLRFPHTDRGKVPSRVINLRARLSSIIDGCACVCFLRLFACRSVRITHWFISCRRSAMMMMRRRTMTFLGVCVRCTSLPGSFPIYRTLVTYDSFGSRLCKRQGIKFKSF